MSQDTLVFLSLVGLIVGCALALLVKMIVKGEFKWEL